MKDTKNEPVIEFAKNFIDDCSNFEIKNLDSAKSEQNNLSCLLYTSPSPRD